MSLRMGAMVLSDVLDAPILQQQALRSSRQWGHSSGKQGDTAVGHNSGQQYRSTVHCGWVQLLVARVVVHAVQLLSHIQPKMQSICHRNSG